MPYYKWAGIDQQGVVCRGAQFARSPELLAAHLSKDAVHLVRCREYTPLLNLKSSIAPSFFKEFALLIASGIPIHQALSIVQKLYRQGILTDVLKDAQQAVGEGFALSVAFSSHKMFSPLLLALIKAGEESGTLKKVFDYYADYREQQHHFRKKLRMLFIIPAITFIFFFLVFAGLFLMVIPRFQPIFAMLNKPIPYATQLLFTISLFLTNNSYVLFCLFLLVTSMFFIVFLLPTKNIRNYILMQLPFVSKLIQLYSMVFFLQALALLLEGGVHLVDAIELAAEVIDNSFLRAKIMVTAQNIQQGISFRDAFKQFYGDLPELESFITVGESAGILPLMIAQAATFYQKRLYYTAQHITSIVQPSLIIVLGLLICLLIIAIYIPILSFSTIGIIKDFDYLDE